MSAARSAAAEAIAAADFRQRVRIGLSGCYLFCGQEAYMARHCLEEARAAVTDDPSLAAFNILRLSGASPAFGPADIAAAIASPPMLCDRKLIEVHEVDYNSMPASVMESLCAVLDDAAQIGDSAVILYATPAELDPGTPKKPSSLYQTLAAHLTPVRFDQETPARLAGWLRRHFIANGVAAEPAQCYTLMNQCGHSMDILSGEAEKLCAYILAHGGNKLTDEIIMQVASRNLETDTFDFANAVLDRQAARAFAILTDCKRRRERPEFLLYSMVSVCCDLYTVRILLDAGRGRSEIARELHMHEYKAGLYCQAAAARELADLERCIDACGRADIAVKQSAADSYIILDRLLAELLWRPASTSVNR